MPKDTPEPPAAFAALGEAWEALFRANEAFIAVDQTGSKEYARLGMQVLKGRALDFIGALEETMRATAG
jgi:hypothetical protein